MQEKKFQRRKKDFVCENVGVLLKEQVILIIDHCPNCLWSKHVDINPGDRKANCGGMMEPIGIDIKGGEYIIYYRCQKCGYKFRVKTSPQDNFEAILKLL
jgi:predicted Zn-ribbon and HTH transcriptional regulator